MKRRFIEIAGAILAFSLIFAGCGETPDDEADNQNQEQTQNGGENSGTGTENGSQGGGTEGQSSGGENGSSGSGTENSGPQTGNEENKKNYPYWDYYIAEENTWDTYKLNDSSEFFIDIEHKSVLVSDDEIAKKTPYSYLSYNFRPESAGTYYFTYMDKSTMSQAHTLSSRWKNFHNFYGRIFIVDSDNNVISKYVSYWTEMENFDNESNSFMGWNQWFEIEVNEKLVGKKLSIQFISNSQGIYNENNFNGFYEIVENWNFSNIKIIKDKPTTPTYISKILIEKETLEIEKDLFVNYSNSPVLINDVVCYDNTISFKTSFPDGVESICPKFACVTKVIPIEANTEMYFEFYEKNDKFFSTDYTCDFDNNPELEVEWIGGKLRIKNGENKTVTVNLNIYPEEKGVYNFEIKNPESLNLDGYYLVGSMCNWDNTVALPFVKSKDNKYEYVVEFISSENYYDENFVFIKDRGSWDNMIDREEIFALNGGEFGNGLSCPHYNYTFPGAGAVLNGLKPYSKYRMTINTEHGVILIFVEEIEYSAEEKALNELKRNAIMEVGSFIKDNNGNTYFSECDNYNNQVDFEIEESPSDGSFKIVSSFIKEKDNESDNYIWLGTNYHKLGNFYSNGIYSIEQWLNYVNEKEIFHYKGSVIVDGEFAKITETEDSKELISVKGLNTGYNYNFVIIADSDGQLQMKIEKGDKLLQTTLKLLVKGLPVEAEGQIAVIGGSFDGWSGWTSCWGGKLKYTDMAWGEISADGTVEIELGKIFSKENTEYSYECCGYYGEADADYDIAATNGEIRLGVENIPLEFTGKEGTYTFTVDLTDYLVTSSFSK